ncbi:hypothetical protein A33M_1959 [Rhodovulum sp. PH10]|nr:hypothetical protein A33M_1959 [Rhodovulum sp. PH10]
MFPALRSPPWRGRASHATFGPRCEGPPAARPATKGRRDASRRDTSPGAGEQP